MNILLIVTLGEIGGTQVAVLNLAKEFRKLGHEVTVGVGKGDFLSQELEKDRIPMVRFPSLRRSYNPWANLSYLLEVRNFLRKHQFEVVHFNSSNALLGAVGAKLANRSLKTCFTFHGLSMLDGGYETSPLMRLLYLGFFRALLPFVDQPVFVSWANFNQARKLGLNRKGAMVYNGLDPESLCFTPPQEARAFLGRLVGRDLRDRFVVGSIGRLAYQKNYEFLIEVFPQVLKIKTNACSIIMGDGPQKAQYQRMIAAMNLKEHIFLVGAIKEAYRYIPGFDLFVLPSRYEGLSITLIEALFAGMPILTTKVGGNLELLNYSEQQLFALNDKEEFIDKFKKIIVTKIMKNIIRQNRIQARHFTIHKTAEKYLKLYQKTIDS